MRVDASRKGRGLYIRFTKRHFPHQNETPNVKLVLTPRFDNFDHGGLTDDDTRSDISDNWYALVQSNCALKTLAVHKV